MARRNLSPLFPIALSPAQLAQTLQIDPGVIYAAISAGELKVYQRGVARRVMVMDACLWIEKHWDIVTRTRRNKHTEENPHGR